MAGAAPPDSRRDRGRGVPRAPVAYPLPARMQNEAPPSSAGTSRTRRRLPLAWLPLLLGGAYYAVHGAIASKPSLEAMVPADAVLVWRYRDLAAYDERNAGDPGPVGTVNAPASLALGAAHNLGPVRGEPGPFASLPGVDRHRPLLEVILDPGTRPDPRYVVLPVEDRGALLSRWRNPDLAERHASHLAVHGDWAACGWDLGSVTHAGTGRGPVPDAPGALWSVTADWPRFVDFVLLPTQASREPQASLLAGLGFKPSTASWLTAPEHGGAALEVQAGRVPFVRDAWSRVTIHAFADRVRAELVPAAATDLPKALAAAFAAADAPWRVETTLPVEAGLVMHGPLGRRATALALWYAGLRWPRQVLENGMGALRLDGAGPLAIFASMDEGPFPTWALALVGPATAHPDLAAFGLPTPPPMGSSPLPAGAVPLMTPYGGESPAGVVVARSAAAGAAGAEVVTLGHGAAALADRLAGIVTARRGDAPAKGAEVELASFRLSADAVQRLLVSAVGTRGLLATLAGTDLEGTLSTDGTRVLLEIRRAAK